MPLTNITVLLVHADTDAKHAEIAGRWRHVDSPSMIQLCATVELFEVLLRTPTMYMLSLLASEPWLSSSLGEDASDDDDHDENHIQVVLPTCGVQVRSHSAH